MVSKRELIRELARKADVSQAEAADAVDELGLRILRAVKRIQQTPQPPAKRGQQKPYERAILQRIKGISNDNPG